MLLDFVSGCDPRLSVRYKMNTLTLLRTGKSVPSHLVAVFSLFQGACNTLLHPSDRDNEEREGFQIVLN